MTTLDQIDKTRVPQHVAIIMDGNGRWAMKQQQERLFGHHNGLTAVRQAVEAAVQMGVKYLTLYTFSTENWNRPQAEVDGLMELLITAIEENTAMLMENGVRLETIGDFGRIPERSRERFRQCMRQTSVNSKLTLIIALSYSSRWEIAEALMRKPCAATSVHATTPTPTCLSAPAASCASPTSSCGRWPIPNSISANNCGPTSSTRTSMPLSSTTRAASAVSVRRRLRWRRKGNNNFGPSAFFSKKSYLNIIIHVKMSYYKVLV